MNSNVEALSALQKKLKAPKGQFNSFGKYKYRSCEDIVEAVKKELEPNQALVLSDELLSVADRVYVKATATLKLEGGEISAHAYAREPLAKKGMDESQVTGAASSYARKYALNGLFAIDDTKLEAVIEPDADETYDDEIDPSEYVMPVGFAGVKGEKLKNIDNKKLHEQLDYWSKNAKTKKAKEAVAALQLYLGDKK